MPRATEPATASCCLFPPPPPPPVFPPQVRVGISVGHPYWAGQHDSGLAGGGARGPMPRPPRVRVGRTGMLLLGGAMEEIDAHFKCVISHVTLFRGSDWQ